MNKDYLPSKKFIRTFCIIAGLLLLIWGVVELIQYIQQKKIEENTVVTTLTIKDIIETDTDKDGVPDWEESLWGLDVENPTTYKVADREYITERQAELAKIHGTATPTENLNETDLFSREYLVTMLSLNQKGEVDDASAEALAQSISTSIKDNNTLPEPYSEKTITSVPNSPETARAYQSALAKAFGDSGVDSLGSELPLLLEVLDGGSRELLSEIKAVAEKYETYAKAVNAIPVPDVIALEHIRLANTLSKLGKSTENLIQSKDNPLIALVGIDQYYANLVTLSEVSETLTTYFTKNGIVGL